MIGMEITINDSKKVKVGIHREGNFGTILNCIRTKKEVKKNIKGDFRLYIGGLITYKNKNKFVHWEKSKLIKVGDEIHIKIIDSNKFDKPSEERIEKKDFIEKQEKKYYLKLKDKYK